MKTPNEVLREEHGAIEVLLGALDGIAVRLRAGESVPKDDLYDAMTGIVEFTDKCHQAKEESVLFPAVAAASPEVGAGTVRRLTGDHRALRNLVGTIRDLVPGSRTKAVRRQIGKHLTTYARVLRAHILAEEEHLFPEAARRLSAAEAERILAAFDRIEREDVGLGMHAAYLSIINRLSREYPYVTIEPDSS